LQNQYIFLSKILHGQAIFFSNYNQLLQSTLKQEKKFNNDSDETLSDCQLLIKNHVLIKEKINDYIQCLNQKVLSI
jgi:hypothetical protein